jgi:hypothetical protein
LSTLAPAQAAGLISPRLPASSSDAAARVGVSCSTIRRWWAEAGLWRPLTHAERSAIQSEGLRRRWAGPACLGGLTPGASPRAAVMPRAEWLAQRQD